MSTVIKVGLFATICLVILGYLVLRIEDVSLFSVSTQTVDATFDSVVGLDDKAAVRIAGVRVGRVDGIGLDGARARVSLRLETPVELTEGTTANISTVGMLGEKYVELVLGPPGAPPLPEGAVLIGTAPMTFDQAMAKLNDVAESIQGVTGTLKGEGGEESPLSRLITNLEATSADIRALLADNRQQLNATIGNFERFSSTLATELPRLTAQIERVLGQVDTLVAENRDNLKDSLANIRAATERAQASVDNMNQITGKIASGEGTVGKLVQDDEAHAQLMSALGSVEKGVVTLTDTLGKVGKLELDLGIEGAYLSQVEESRAAFSLNVDPQSGRFYRVEIVDDPRGRVRRKTDVVTVIDEAGNRETTTTETVKTEETTTLSAQFGLKLGDARLRAGLFESTGGAGIDYGLLDRRLWFSLEAFDFSRQEDLDPHVRLSGRYFVNPHLYVMGGYDDFLVKDRESVFLGAGIRWRDDDLKYLLGSVPRF